jgi:hypothetical protein
MLRTMNATDMSVVSPRYAYIASRIQFEAAKPHRRGHSLCYVLASAFDWASEPEGHKFWQRIEMNLRGA